MSSKAGPTSRLHAVGGTSFQSAETPETSRFTSVYERIQALGQQPADAQAEVEPKPPDSRRDERPQCRRSQAEPANKPTRAAWLSPFELSQATAHEPVPSARASNKGCLPMSFAEYLDLLDSTGRQLRQDKRGAIPQDRPSGSYSGRPDIGILSRLAPPFHSHLRQFRRIV